MATNSLPAHTRAEHRFADRLAGWRERKGGGWEALCPAHDDHNPSLHIDRRSDDRGIVVICRACGPDAFPDIITALGMSDADVFDDRHEHRTIAEWAGVEGRLEATYTYTDHNNLDVARKLKYRRADGSKDFRWETREPDGWRPGRHVTVRMYRQWQAEHGGTGTLYVVEGEKDADTLADAGELAVSPPDGASASLTDSMLDWLAAWPDRLVIIADNDQAGLRHGQRLVEALTVRGRHTALLTTPEGAGNDVTDLLNGGGQLDWLEPVDELDESLVEDIVEPAPERPGGEWIFDTDTTMRALWGEADEILWPEGEGLMIAAPTGAGKTTLAAQITYALCGLQDQVLGYPVREARRVLYIAADRPIQIAAAFQRLATPSDRDQLDQRLLVLPMAAPFDLTEHPGALLHLVERTECDTMIIDSLRDLASNVSGEEQAFAVLGAIKRVLAAGVQLMALHHDRKRSSDDTRRRTELDVDDIYGSTRITAGFGSIISLQGQPGDPVVRLQHVKAPREQVGPFDVLHDHQRGRSTISDKVDLVRMAAEHAKTEMGGLTAAAAAVALFEPKGGSPSKSHRQRARRRLEAIEKQGLLRSRRSPLQAQGTPPTVWAPAAGEPQTSAQDDLEF